MKELISKFKATLTASGSDHNLPKKKKKELSHEHKSLKSSGASVPSPSSSSNLVSSTSEPGKNQTKSLNLTSKIALTNKHKKSEFNRASSNPFSGVPKSKESLPEIQVKIVNQALTYEPNSFIEGKVHLKLKNSITNICLVLNFEGLVVVRKNNNKIKNKNTNTLNKIIEDTDVNSDESSLKNECNNNQVKEKRNFTTDTQSPVYLKNNFNSQDELLKDIVVVHDQRFQRNDTIHVLFDKNIVLYGEDNKVSENSLYGIINGLTKGEHIFPFKIKIPKTSTSPIYSSFNFEKGSIGYFLKAKLQNLIHDGSDDLKIVDRPNLAKQNKEPSSDSLNSSTNASQDHLIGKKILSSFPDLSSLKKDKTENWSVESVVKEIYVINPVDVSPYSEKIERNITLGAQKHTHAADQTTIGKFKSNKTDFVKDKQEIESLLPESKSSKIVEIKAELNHGGYVLGDKIHIKFNLKHYKEFLHPIGVVATLLRICEVYDGQEVYRKDICQTSIPIVTSPKVVTSEGLSGDQYVKHEYEQNLYLKVPLDILPTLAMPDCNFFQFKYRVEILVNLSKKNSIVTENNNLLLDGVSEHERSDLKQMFRLTGKQKRGMTTPSKGYSQNELVVLQKKILNKRGVNDIYDIDNPLQCYFYQDLIDVEKLKKLNNVAAMSMSILVGTYRQNTGTDSLALNENTPAAPIAGQMSNAMNETVGAIYEQIAANNYLSQQPTESFPEWNSSDELPEYSYNSGGVHTGTGVSDNVFTDNKEDLEQQRLQNMESEPPM